MPSAKRFATDYEREYTYTLDAPVELVAYHLVAMAEVDKLEPEKLSTSDEPSSRMRSKAQREVDYCRSRHPSRRPSTTAMPWRPGMNFIGPAIIEEAGATTVIPPGLPCQWMTMATITSVTAP